MRVRHLVLSLCLVGCSLDARNGDPVPQIPPPAPATGDTGGTSVPADDCEDAPDQARQILSSRCAACHGPGSVGYNGFDDATDREGLVADGWVVPSDPEASRIFDQIDRGLMPTPVGGGPLVEEERASVERWIACGAEGWEEGELPEPRGFVSPEMEIQAALEDVRDLDSEDRIGPEQPNARYLSLVPLYNAGVDSEQIALYRTALTKLVWSLTVEDPRSPPGGGSGSLVPVQLDGFEYQERNGDRVEIRIADDLGESLLFRVDQRIFGWDNGEQEVDVWEELVKAYPFAVRYDGRFEAAEDLVALTRTRIPIVHGDWFAANASLPPLYYDVLDVPETYDAFLLRFGGLLDPRAELEEAEVDCAGMDGASSLVSVSNRVICRHRTAAGYCWESFDFDQTVGDPLAKDIFSNPAGFFEAEDGGEAFCSLESGQQVYFVYDAFGQRLDEAPTAVVSDYNLDSGGVVKEGLHCIRCHELGVIDEDDQILPFVELDPNNFDDEVVDAVRLLYPPNTTLDGIYLADIAEFQESLDQMSPPVVTGRNLEPIWELAQDHEAPLTAARVAAELGLPEGELASLTRTDSRAEAFYQGLFVSGAKIDRQRFESEVRSTICDLTLGDDCDPAVFCGLSAVPCAEGSTCDALGQCSKIAP